MIDHYNPNQLQSNMINPNAMSNMQTLQGINGVPMVGTANRAMPQYPGAVDGQPQYPGAIANQPQYTKVNIDQSQFGTTPNPFNQNLQAGIMPNNNY